MAEEWFDMERRRTRDKEIEVVVENDSRTRNGLNTWKSTHSSHLLQFKKQRKFNSQYKDVFE